MNETPRMGATRKRRDFEFEAESSRRKLAVIRRCPAPSTMIVAALAFVVGSRPICTQADGMYAPLTSTTGIPVPGANLTAPQVEYLITPPGGVVPPTGSDGTPASPLKILSGSTGFDASQLVVALKSTTSSTGAPEQILGLVFFGQGLAASSAGGLLNFSLSTGSNPPPELTLLGPNTYGLPLTLDPIPPPATGGEGGSLPANNPEPLSILVWTIMACVGLLRVRAHRRARQVALAG